MSLQELARLKTLALSPDATPWDLRQSVCRLAVEHEWLMHTHAALRERWTASRWTRDLLVQLIMPEHRRSA